MASKVTKSQGRWRFSFYSSAMERRGHPARKYFTFSTDRYKKSDVERIRDHYEQLYHTGRFNPWTDSIADTYTAPEGSLSVKQAYENYADHIPNELAPKTVQVAKSFLDLLIRKLGQMDVNDLTSIVLTDHVNSYDNHHTRRTVKYHIDRFTKWMVTEGLIEKQPQIREYSTTAERKKSDRVAITFEQLTLLIDTLRAERDNLLKKDHVRADQVRQVYQRHEDMIMVGFYMGLRMNEMIHCRPAWVVNDFRFLQIGDLYRWRLKDEYHPKSQKEHDDLIVIPPEVQPIFRRRVQSCSGMYQRLFGINYAKRFQEPLKKISRKAFGEDFSKGFSPHSLRHSCATYWINERRIPIEEVQRLMRHADIRMTMKYRHASTDAHYAAFHGGQMRSI